MNYFKIYRASLKKSKKLQKISRILGEEFDFNEFLNASSEDREDRNLRDRIKKTSEEELIDLIVNDYNLSTVIKHYGVKREELMEIYKKLQRMGLGFWVKGHYVAASAIAYVRPLDYLLRNRDVFNDNADLNKIAKVQVNLSRYFKNRKISID